MARKLSDLLDIKFFILQLVAFGTGFHNSIELSYLVNIIFTIIMM